MKLLTHFGNSANYEPQSDHCAVYERAPCPHVTRSTRISPPIRENLLRFQDLRMIMVENRCVYVTRRCMSVISKLIDGDDRTLMTLWV